MEHNGQPDIHLRGTFEARYLAFLETITHLRPSLHRYCSRMTGTAVDGEDVVQDALFQAYRKLDTFDDDRPLAPWLFRIAHNRCIDFLRRRETREEAEVASAPTDSIPPVEARGRELGQAVEHLVLTLPPMERACVLLKDVFDYSLDEIAELVDSTVGGVKSALSRGRSKLTATSGNGARSARPARGDDAKLLHLYVERFNARDWDGLRELIAADARVRVADRFTGLLTDAPYFGNYERSRTPWRLTVGEIDGESVVVVLRPGPSGWAPASVVRLDIADGRITTIRDYWHCPWLVSSATSLVVAASDGKADQHVQ